MASEYRTKLLRIRVEIVDRNAPNLEKQENMIQQLRAELGRLRITGDNNAFLFIQDVSDV